MPSSSDPTVLFMVGQTAQQANGGVTSVLSIASRLERTNPVLVTNRASAALDRVKDRGVRVVIEPSLELDWGLGVSSFARRKLVWLERVARTNARVLRIARDVRADVLHANDLPGLYLSAPAARLAGIPVVWNIRDLTNVRGAKWRAGRVLSDVVITLSGDMKRRVEQALPPMPLGPSAPIDAIYSVVDTDLVRPLSPEDRRRVRGELGIGDDEVAVGVVAAFLERKQQVELLDAVARRGPGRATWTFVGDYRPDVDPYAARFRDRLEADRELARRVRAVGYRRDVERYYQALDLLVVASKEEGLARCMIEGISAGTPVVSFDVASAAEILEGHGAGRVVRGGDFGALLDRVEELAEDAAQRRAMGERGRAAAIELFSGRKNVDRYEDLYAQLASRRRR